MRNPRHVAVQDSDAANELAQAMAQAKALSLRVAQLEAARDRQEQQHLAEAMRLSQSQVVHTISEDEDILDDNEQQQLAEAVRLSRQPQQKVVHTIQETSSETSSEDEDHRVGCSEVDARSAEQWRATGDILH